MMQALDFNVVSLRQLYRSEPREFLTDGLTAEFSGGMFIFRDQVGILIFLIAWLYAAFKKTHTPTNYCML